MIKNFKCKETEKIWHGEFSKKFAVDIQKTARRKLKMLDDSMFLEDLKYPPGNRLEGLYGDRAGQCSIRINQRYRICFRFIDGDCYSVEMLDYH